MPAARVKLLPLPAAQVVPPLLLNSQVAPASRLLTCTVPVRVMPSVPLDPVSDAKARVGAAALVSTVTAPRLAAVPRLPAASVCRTCTVPAA